MSISQDSKTRFDIVYDIETFHVPVLNYFLNWCNEAFLELNVTKTKDMCNDFRRHNPAPVNTTINGQDIESQIF